MSLDDIGFLTFAQNTQSTDYLRLAYLQALNVKHLHPGWKFAIVVDKDTHDQIEEKHKKIFDHIIPIQVDYNKPDSNWKLANEFQSYGLSPFKETIKLESDLLFPRNITHWLNAFRFRDVVLSTGCKHYFGHASESRFYRKFFDDNHLPDVYNGLMYFRKSQTAFEFFKLAENIFINWDTIKERAVKNCREDTPSTDVLYAIAAQLFGPERCTLPSFDFINFVHMKPNIQGLPASQAWYDVVMSEQDEDIIRVNNLNQYHPVHYYDKGYATDELIEYYEQRIGIN
jgi:hypothetical protein